MQIRPDPDPHHWLELCYLAIFFHALPRSIKGASGRPLFCECNERFSSRHSESLEDVYVKFVSMPFNVQKNINLACFIRNVFLF